MATWSTGQGEIACPHCGAMHAYSYRDYPERDRGRQECLACGKELMHWSSTRDYSDFKLAPVKQ